MNRDKKHYRKLSSSVLWTHPCTLKYILFFFLIPSGKLFDIFVFLYAGMLHLSFIIRWWGGATRTPLWPPFPLWLYRQVAIHQRDLPALQVQHHKEQQQPRPGGGVEDALVLLHRSIFFYSILYDTCVFVLDNVYKVCSVKSML